ncbi:MAG TPA: head GIN domain-containing protein [Flavisolibacter sp.]|nr:head GIN domain-containing protein [Flavisolibacter sp.]
MKKILFSLFIVITIGASAQKTINDPNAEVRTISTFHALQISNAFEVVLTQGNEEGLAVSANEKDDITKIKTTVENGVLRIWFDDNNKWWPKNRKLKAYISVKTLDQIKAGGASDINIEGGLKVPSLKLDMSGASDLEGVLTVAGELSVRLSGASDITISGAAEKMTIDVSGASDVKAYDFTANTCSVDASGASSVRITADKEMSVKLSGASSVSYKGNATIRDIKTSGASSISRKS